LGVGLLVGRLVGGAFTPTKIRTRASAQTWSSSSPRGTVQALYPHSADPLRFAWLMYVTALLSPEMRHWPNPGWEVISSTSMSRLLSSFASTSKSEKVLEDGTVYTSSLAFKKAPPPPPPPPPPPFLAWTVSVSSAVSQYLVGNSSSAHAVYSHTTIPPASPAAPPARRYVTIRSSFGFSSHMPVPETLVTPSTLTARSPGTTRSLSTTSILPRS